MPSVLENLKSSMLFRNLRDDTLGRLLEQFDEEHFDKDEVIFQEGKQGNKLYLLTEGEITIFKSFGWGEHELKRFHTGEVFGEMALISLEARTATARTITPCTCLTLSQGPFDTLLEEDPQFAQSVLRLLTQRLKQTGDANTRELLNSYQALIFSLAKLAESRDSDTGAHLNRVRAYCRLLSQMLMEDEKFKSRVTPQFMESIYITSPLHDIGKVAIPDSILLKQGKLTPEERAVMQTHAERGAEAVRTVLEYCDHETFHMAYRIVRYHHERYDGSGYPTGLAGEDIPLEARIMTLADVYDALLSVRVYKPALNHDQVMEIMHDMSGSAFDPYIAGLMFSNIDKFESIHTMFCSLEINKLS